MKIDKKTFQQAGSILIIFFLAISSSSFIVWGSEETTMYLPYSFSFSPPTITEETINGIIYHHISIDDTKQTNGEGLPMVPVTPYHVLLPLGYGVEQVSINCQNQVSLGVGYNIPCGNAMELPPDLLFGQISDQSSQGLPGINMGVTPIKGPSYPDTSPTRHDVLDQYAGTPRFDPSQPYPPQTYEEVATFEFRGYALHSFNICPIHYIADTGELYYYENIDITLTVNDTGEMSDFFRGLPGDEQMMEQITDDFVMEYTYQQGKGGHDGGKTTSLVDPADTYNYVIITNEALLNANGEYTLQDLVSHKNALGLSATIVTVEDIEACSAYQWYGVYGDHFPFFDDTQCHIRNFIKDAFMHWETDYVLLAGDDPVIPCRRLFCLFFAETSFPHLYLPFWSHIPADMYYSCLNGNFNTDRDSRWGELTDLPDSLAEVYIGRACVENEDEVSMFVEKTLAYHTTESQYLENVVFAGEYIGFGGVSEYAGNYLDEMIDGCDTHGYSTVGVPSSVYDVDTLYDRDWPGHEWEKEDIFARINEPAHIINHLGHGNNYHVLKMDEPVYMSNGQIYSEVHDVLDHLDNTHHCFIYSQACYPGAFDNVFEGVELDYDSIAEYLTVKSEHGAFAMICNSRFGWGAGNSTDGPSQRFARWFFDSIYGEGQNNPLYRQLGVAHQYSKDQNRWQFLDGNMRYCYYELNLLGDPHLSLKLPPDNDPPYPPSTPYPEDGATEVETNVILSWTGGDPDPGDTVTYDVYFGTDSTPDEDELVSEKQSSTTYAPGQLQHGQQYHWMIISHDNHEESTSGMVWDFTTREMNHPPTEPYDPNPYDGEANVAITHNLYWSGGDPDPDDTVTYDVYLEANDPSPDIQVADDITSTSYDPGDLLFDTTYYWKIEAFDGDETVVGDTWSFSTEINHPPTEPYDPDPDDLEQDVIITHDLYWLGGDPDPGDTVTYDVYFGTDPTPDAGEKVSNDQSATYYTLGTLEYDTTYYWKIVAQDNHGETTVGDIWEFHTEPAPPPEWITASDFSDPDNKWDDEPYASDYDADTKATSTETGSLTWRWTKFLILDVPGYPDTYDKIRFKAWYDLSHCKWVDIDVNILGDWFHFYQGSYQDEVWKELDISHPPHHFMKIAIRFYVKPYYIPLEENYVIADLYEVQFHPV